MALPDAALEPSRPCLQLCRPAVAAPPKAVAALPAAAAALPTAAVAALPTAAVVALPIAAIGGPTLASRAALPSRAAPAATAAARLMLLLLLSWLAVMSLPSMLRVEWSILRSGSMICSFFCNVTLRTESHCSTTRPASLLPLLPMLTVQFAHSGPHTMLLLV
ncbi:unnamed protein product [Closterium sp. NIES-54]